MRKILALIGAFSFGNVAAANGEDWFTGALIGAITVGLLPDLFRVFKLLCSFLVWFYCFVSLLLNLFRMFKGFISEKAKIFREAGDVSPPPPRKIRGSEVVHKIDVASSSRQPDESQGRRIGEKIPYPPSSKFVLDAPSNRGSEKVPPVTSSKFVLDPAKIEALARETDEIQSILSEMMADVGSTEVVEPLSEIAHKIDTKSSSGQANGGQSDHDGEKVPPVTSSKFVLDPAKIEALAGETDEIQSILLEMMADVGSTEVVEPPSKITHKIDIKSTLRQADEIQSDCGGEKVPLVTSSRFVLDPAKIEALARETDEIQSILSEKMAELEPSVSAKDQECSVEQELVAWLSELDTRYHTALLAIIKHNLISTEDFDALAAREHLISEDLFNTINSWSDDALGDFLLEKSEDILIRKELLLNIPVLVADYQYDN